MIKISKFGFRSSQLWLLRHHSFVERFLLQEGYDPDDILDIFRLMLEDPNTSKRVIEDSLLSNDEKYFRFLNFVRRYGLIILVDGDKGSGKSAFVAKVLEDLKMLFNVNAYYFCIFKFPNFAKRVFDLSDVPDSSHVVIDEAAVLADSRDSSRKGNKNLTDILPILRHKKITFWVITQNLSMTDVKFFKLSDVQCYKPMSEASMSQERDSVIDPLVALMMPRKKEPFLWSDEVLVRISSFDQIYKFRHGLAKCWNERLSRCYSQISEEEGVEFAYTLSCNDWDTKNIKLLLEKYGVSKGVQEWDDIFRSRMSR